MNEDIQCITAMFFTKPHYKTIRIRDNGDCIRQIKYKQEDIQAVVNPIYENILTVIPPTFLSEENFESYDILCEAIKKYKTKIKKLKQENKRILSESKIFRKHKVFLKIGKWFIGKELNHE